MFNWLSGLWFTLKNLFETRLGLDDAALHLVLGPLLYLVIMALFRLSPRSIVAWLLVLGVQLANEASDLYWASLKGDDSLPASALDTVATMLVPTIVLLLARSRARSLQRQPAAVTDGPDEDVPVKSE